MLSMYYHIHSLFCVWILCNMVMLSVQKKIWPVLMFCSKLYYYYYLKYLLHTTPIFVSLYSYFIFMSTRFGIRKLTIRKSIVWGFGFSNTFRARQQYYFVNYTYMYSILDSRSIICVMCVQTQCKYIEYMYHLYYVIKKTLPSARSLFST